MYKMSLPRCYSSIPLAQLRRFTGIDRESFRAVSGGFVFLQGQDMEGPDDILVDDWAAKAKGLKVGDTFNVLNHDWHVNGIIEHGKGARLFVSLTTLQDSSGRA